jgi:transposase
MSTLPNEIKEIRQEFNDISYALDERRIRLWCAARARTYNRKHGRGGVMAVYRATGISRSRIYTGIKELKHEQKLEKTRVRQAGGGRKKTVEKYPELLKTLEQLVEPYTRGDPESPLRWTKKSTPCLQRELVAHGYPVSQPQVGKLLKRLGYSLQAPRKTDEGGNHPDRDVQFTYIHEQMTIFQAQGWPIISVEAKKKEKIGNYGNTGREYRKKGQPVQVKVYDFVDKTLGKVIPYGIYDVSTNTGFVNVGGSYDTAEFAVNSIRAWWRHQGVENYPNAQALLIVADGGGSNGSRVRLWKVELQRLANELSLSIHVCHYPPGTSKWNPIEHRMFCHISHNWRGQPLCSREVVVNLMNSTTTKTGLRILACLDERVYEKGKKMTDEELDTVNITRAVFQGKWNYIIHPIQSNQKV